MKVAGQSLQWRQRSRIAGTRHFKAGSCIVCRLLTSKTVHAFHSLPVVSEFSRYLFETIKSLACLTLALRLFVDRLSFKPSSSNFTSEGLAKYREVA